MILIDTSYLVGLVMRSDELHERAVALSAALTGPFAVTEYVLLEFVNRLSHPQHRARAHAFLTSIGGNRAITVVAAEPDLWRRGLALHSRREDKEWSLTDCISFIAMQDLGAVEALTNDQHFEQAGFRALLRHPPPG